jgi:Suppressor of fused protein (SUFU)
MTTLYEHLEVFAGEIVQGWPSDSKGNKLPFQVVQTAGGPHLGTTTFSTLGLSNFPLPADKTSDAPKLIRNELLMVVPAGAVPPNIVGVIQQAGLEVLARGFVYLRGELLGPKGEIFAGYEPKALYASLPVYFPDEFWTVTVEGIGEIALVWLVPLLDEEVNFLSMHGWRDLESRLASEDPNLVDYARKT